MECVLKMMNIKRFRKAQRGVALVIVLGALILVTTLVVAFLSSVTSTLKSSKSYADDTSSRLLSDLPVNIVIGQIKEATKGRDSSGLLAWASQPGMIRTYDSSGAPAGYYKLYSSGTMAGEGAFDPASNAESVPKTWDADTAIYTDLNEPLIVGSGANQAVWYPIVDPAADSVNNKTDDPIRGFSIDKANPAVSGKQNLAPMPVMWLYQLADGTLVAPTGSGAKATVPGATASNPIVSRVAFWTDDETCKININTASEGVFWDTPRVVSDFDRNSLAQCQPAKNEFQRYPGHPAMTSLSPVFGYSGNTNPSPHLPVPKGGAVTATNYSQLNQYYTIAPRVNDGGSKGGTVTAGGSITPDSDRLYTDIDELAFQPPRIALEDMSINMDARFLKQTRFFLTANSRSPDVNLFNQPRVIIWPESAVDDNAHRSVLDRAIAFCGTIGGKAYYFVRNDPNSPTSDLAAGRNPVLLSYLRTLTGAPDGIPGFGGNFASKYGADRDQILTAIFDYIRCANLMDPSVSNPFTPVSSPQSVPGQGQVVPIADAATGTRGFGRFPTMDKAFLQFIGVADKSVPNLEPPVATGKIRVQAVFIPNLFDPSQGWGPNHPNFKLRISGLDKFTWDGATSMGFPQSATIIVQKANTSAHGIPLGGNQGFLHLLDGRTLGNGDKVANYPYFSSTFDLPTAAPGTFAFTGGDVKIEFLTNDPAETVIQSITVNFPNSPFPLPTLSPVAGRSFDARFATLGTTPTILSSSSSSYDVVRSVQTAHGDVRIVAGRSAIIPTDGLFAMHPSYLDVTKPMAHNLFTPDSYPYVGATGDGVKRGKLAKDAKYYSQSSATTINGSTFQKAIYDSEVSINGVTTGSAGIPGDWDNGVGNIKDGAYINKPDEGNSFGAGTGDAPYFDQLKSYSFSAGTYFSPNRQMPSAVMFGSLPTGVKANQPWQTLLFRSLPLGHPGQGTPASGGTVTPPSPPYASPPDHLWLDLFTMPVVEPYPISEPLSTAGRINLNYQIVPFTYLKRTTGILAVLSAERMLAVMDNQASQYKTGNYPATQPAIKTDYRLNLSVNEILNGLQARFDAGDIYRSASEICGIHMVPAGTTPYNGMAAFWSSGYAVNGDNSRERPYANIYPRLTTKSNSFTVHYRVQILQRSQARLKSAPTEFDLGGGDRVTAEYRGSTLIERYVDPNDPALPDFASEVDLSDSSYDLEAHYRFRIVKTKRFAP